MLKVFVVHEACDTILDSFKAVAVAVFHCLVGEWVNEMVTGNTKRTTCVYTTRVVLYAASKIDVSIIIKQHESLNHKA